MVKLAGYNRWLGTKSNWRAKKNIVWEKHNGPVPKGHCVVLLDGDPANCEIGNLVLLTRAELAELNRKHTPAFAGAKANPARIRAAQIRRRVFVHNKK